MRSRLSRGQAGRPGLRAHQVGSRPSRVGAGVQARAALAPQRARRDNRACRGALRRLALPMTEPDFRHTLRVYWEDTDAGGVVFFANYLKFFERARTEWLRGMGFGQQQLRTDTGAVFVVVDTSVRYVSPARLDDELSITVQIAEAGRVSLSIAQQA